MTVRRAQRRNARVSQAAWCVGAVLALAGAPLAWGQGGEAGEIRGRRVIEGPPTALGFRNVTVEQLIPFIVEATGKVVMPQQDVLTRRITVLNDSPIPRAQALDLVFLALQQNGVGVVETETTITLRDVGEITRQDVPVVGPDSSVLDRTDLGAMVEKVFTLRNSSAKTLGDTIKDALPPFAKLTIDEESNQIAVLGNIALLQRLERLITALDRPPAGALQTETYRLRFADAEQIKTNIEELFSASSTARRQTNQRGGNQQQNQGGPGAFFRAMGGGEGGQAATAATAGDIRVTANTQQNSITVVADPAILAQIRQQITDNWDLPLPEEAVVPKIYDLKHSDPVKVRDLLEGLFGRPAGAAAPRAGGQGGGQGGQAGGSASQGVGRLAGQFSFQAIPESGRLVVVARSPDNIAVIDRIIEGLDQPQSTGLPEVVELKHANAEDLAEQLNALLATDGTLAAIRRSESGLTSGGATASPFASEQATTTENQNTEASTADTIRFWWQSARSTAERRSASNLVGQLRIVPVWRQNALLVAAPPEYRSSILTLIEQLDRPGRQVLISAIIAEVSRDDATALGLRWSSQNITPTNGDNSISIGGNAEGTRNNWATSLFDTSVLNVDTDVNLLLQALSQKTGVSILSEPRIFTSDNQEAEFFDGQDIPFITDSQTNQNGNLVQSFDYRAVGIQLRIRPRITVRSDVDLAVNLVLASIVPGQTLFGGFVVDRRETTTQLIVQNGQTVVISGIVRSESSDIVRKVPLLGDVPLLGYLFRSKETSVRNTELLVFITPIVVDNTSANDDVNAPYRQRLDNLRQQLDSVAPEGTPRPPTNLQRQPEAAPADDGSTAAAGTP